VTAKLGRAFLLLAAITPTVVPIMASKAQAEEAFSLAGTYTKDARCGAETARRDDLRVKITENEIESNMGVCTILHRKRDGRTVEAQIECKVPGDQLILGDVTFTLRDDKAIDFDDQDHTSPAVLYRCTDSATTGSSAGSQPIAK
jgi:hypothetical protein